MLYFVLGLIIIAIALFKYFIQVVKHDEAIVCEFAGQFRQVRKAGLYLAWPLENCRRIEWFFRHAEPGTLISLSTYRVPLSSLRYDPKPLYCVTKDNFQVTIDLVVNFRVMDAKTAVYSTPNVFAELEDKLESYVYEVIRGLKMVQVTTEQLRELILLEKINKECQLLGIVVLDFRIQSIQLPKGIVDATVANETLRLKNEAEIQRLEAERRHNLSLVESKALEQATKNKMERELSDHQNELRLNAAKVDREMRKLNADIEFDTWERLDKTPNVIPLLIARENVKAAIELGRNEKGKRLIIFADNATTKNLGAWPAVKELLKTS